MSPQRDTGSFYYLINIKRKDVERDTPDEDVQLEEVETETLRALKASRIEPYLKRHPLRPMQEAAKLGGDALAIFLELLHRMDVSGQPVVTLPLHRLAAWGIKTRQRKSRAVRKLSQAGLVSTRQQRGRSVRINLI